ncbi:MAG: glycine--tRNA ligase subunit beta [Steroidobacteraceae bacterium]
MSALKPGTAPPLVRRDFLFELGTEELPPKALPTLEKSLREAIAERLAAAGLVHGALQSFATPRRLAVRVWRLALQQPDQQIRRRGPPLRAAFDAAGAPTRAADAFAASCGVTLDALGRERDEKGNEYLWFGGTKPGATTASLLPGIVSEALAALPIPRRMRWGEGEAQFVRPVHWLVMLLGSEVVPATILGTAAGRSTRGHRFHAPRELPLRAPASYERTLQQRGFVQPDFAARRELIRAQVVAAAEALGGRAIIHPELLDEVTALVEWPVPVSGQFERRFLALPREVLIATLQDHQRYFAVESPDGALLPNFITISNIESRDVAVVRAGNERVVRPRLADAAFFWEQDRRTPLAQRQDGLDRVTFQVQLGSIGAKARRIATLAELLAPVVGAAAAQVVRAAQLCKCDLLTTMVGEFPELQGVMGEYYARADGVEPAIATAIREHYLPRAAGDALPATPAGTALAIADRLDTLAGIFAIGQKPSGTRDPFALRRAAIGLLRIALEKHLEFDLRALLGRTLALAITAMAEAGATTAAPADPAALVAEIQAFIIERLRAMYLEGVRITGVSTEMFDAVLESAPASLPDFEARLRALVSFLTRPEAASLTAANKRIANILKKSASGRSLSVDAQLLQVTAELALQRELEGARPGVEAALAGRDYAAAFTALAALRPVIDDFFESVLVNDSDARLRDNRLALLAQLRALFTRIADLSRLPG